MARYAAALSQHPVPAHAVGETAGQIMDELQGDDPDLVVCFASPHFVGAFDDVAHALRQLLGPKVFLGGTAVSIIGGAHEIEDQPALSVFAGVLGDATLTPVALEVEETPDGAAVVSTSRRSTSTPPSRASVAAKFSTHSTENRASSKSAM